MERHDLHPGLELRLGALSERIANIRRKMQGVSGAEKLQAWTELGALEDRYRALSARLDKLNREGPGIRQNVQAEFEKIADDLTGSLENFTSWVDSAFANDRKPQKHNI